MRKTRLETHGFQELCNFIDFYHYGTINLGLSFLFSLSFSDVQDVPEKIWSSGCFSVIELIAIINFGCKLVVSNNNKKRFCLANIPHSMTMWIYIFSASLIYFSALLSVDGLWQWVIFQSLLHCLDFLYLIAALDWCEKMMEEGNI